MSSDAYAIVVDGVSKNFKLPHEKVSSIKGMFTRGLKKHTKGYEVQHALRDVSFSVKHGEFFGIVGRNGSGKSTLLKILAQIYQPTTGTITTNGRLVPFIELGVGFNPELSGRDNVYLNGALLGFSRSEIDAMYEDIVAFAELENFMDQKLKNYSSGMQVRLAFSVATRAKADILLVDEVLAVGDADFQRKCFNYFKELKKQKKTVVFVSHDMNAVRDYCDRAILIEESKIIEQGQVAKVASAYTKMFIDDNGSSSQQKITRKRWGNKKVEFTSVSVSAKDPEDNNSKLTVTAHYIAKEDVSAPSFGMTVKNGVGTEMFGANNTIAKAPIVPLRSGAKGTMTWETNNILNQGDYSIDLTVIDSETLGEYDWWEDAKTFTIYRSEHTPFVVEPKITMEMHEHVAAG